MAGELAAGFGESTNAWSRFEASRRDRTRRVV
jgi:hypothetical protein